MTKFQCALHWMMSYSVNTTFREDEILFTSDFGGNGGSPYTDNLNYNHGGVNTRTFIRFSTYTRSLHYISYNAQENLFKR
jgi:hypothetical protein